MEFKTFYLYGNEGKPVTGIEYKIENGKITLQREGKKKSFKIKENTKYSFNFTKTTLQTNSTIEEFENRLERTNWPNAYIPNSENFSSLYRALNS